MLDHLELLDDDAPPAIDAATLADVHERANGLRRRTRLTSFGAVATVVIVIAGVVAVARNHDREVKVISPSSTTLPSAPVTRTSAGTLDNGLRVKMTLDTPTVALGRDIALTVEARNDTDETLTIGGGHGVNCILRVTPVIRTAAGTISGYFYGDSCNSVSETLEPGQALSIPVTVATSGISLPDGERNGRYAVGLAPASGRKTAWVTPPLPVEVVAPDLSGRLEITDTDFVSGNPVVGTLVIDNKSGEPIPFCGEFGVVLEHDGVSLTPTLLPVCDLRVHPTRPEIAIGTNRRPFVVPLVNSTCTEKGVPTSDSPRCEADGTAPLLAPGEYQIAFVGVGAFGSLHIPPVSIQVR